MPLRPEVPVDLTSVEITMLMNSLKKSLAVLAVFGLAACGPNQEAVPVDEPAAEEPTWAPEAEPAPAIETEPFEAEDTAVVEEVEVEIEGEGEATVEN